MASAKEIKNRINSVKDTQKITNAMYLIASTKMRKAKADLDLTRPYFNSLQTEVARIFQAANDVTSPYFEGAGAEKRNTDAPDGYLVITADKGLAGAYNQNVLKETIRLQEERGAGKLFVVGEYGRQHFRHHQTAIEKDFLYTAQNPNIHRAREISALLLDAYMRGEINRLFVVYTDFGNGMNANVQSFQVLPFVREKYLESAPADNKEFNYESPAEQVLESIVPSYVTGFIYSALVDSFCSEQNARMTAMDSANSNAQDLLDQLSVQYNHVRQGAITQEITEISSGAKSQKRKSRKEAQRTS